MNGRRQRMRNWSFIFQLIEQMLPWARFNGRISTFVGQLWIMTCNVLFFWEMICAVAVLVSWPWQPRTPQSQLVQAGRLYKKWGTIPLLHQADQNLLGWCKIHHLTSFLAKLKSGSAKPEGRKTTSSSHLTGWMQQRSHCRPGQGITNSWMCVVKQQGLTGKCCLRDCPKVWNECIMSERGGCCLINTSYSDSLLIQVH